MEPAAIIMLDGSLYKEIYTRVAYLGDLSVMLSVAEGKLFEKSVSVKSHFNRHKVLKSQLVKSDYPYSSAVTKDKVEGVTPVIEWTELSRLNLKFTFEDSSTNNLLVDCTGSYFFDNNIIELSYARISKKS